MELRLGKVPNLERKFIPTKKEKFLDYFSKMELLERYEIVQTFHGGYKYRRYNHNGQILFTRHLKKDYGFTDIEQISEQEFGQAMYLNNDRHIKKIRSYYRDSDFEFDVDEFFNPVKFVMVEVAVVYPEQSGKLPLYVPPKGFLEVTSNLLFQNRQIFDGSVIPTNAILEGSDAVGKTTLAADLLNDGIICQDRCAEVISPNMLFTVPMHERAEVYYRYLTNNPGIRVIFMYNMDKAEIEKRIAARLNEGPLSEYDDQAFQYGVLYKDTFDYMAKTKLMPSNLYALDCTDKEICGVKEEIKKILKL